MIKNDHQYQVTKSWVEKFSQALASVRQNEDKKNLDPDGWQLLQDSYQSQLSGLQKELIEYETLITHDPHQPVVVALDNFNKISDLLIKARLALKITQQELAALSDRSEEQIKAYEEKDYQTASFLDFLAISDVLGIQLIDGKLLAALDDFYKDRLAGIRTSATASKNLRIPGQ